MGFRLFGKPGKIIVDVSISLSQAGFCCAYVFTFLAGWPRNVHHPLSLRRLSVHAAGVTRRTLALVAHGVGGCKPEGCNPEYHIPVCCKWGSASGPCVCRLARLPSAGEDEFLLMIP